MTLHILHVANDGLKRRFAPCKRRKVEAGRRDPRPVSQTHSRTLSVVLLQTGPDLLGWKGHGQKFRILFKGFWLLGLLKLYIYSGGAAECSLGHWIRKNWSWLQQAYLVAWYRRSVSCFHGCLGLCRPLEILWEESFFFFLSQVWALTPHFPLVSYIFWEWAKALLRSISFLIDLKKNLKVRSHKLNQLIWSPILGKGHEICISYNLVKAV